MLLFYKASLIEFIFWRHKSIFMKILLEGSTLFIKGYTGIQNYIIHLHNALQKNKEIQVFLGFPLKKIIKLKPNFINQKNLWFAGTFLFSLKHKPEISHSLHSPFLQIRGTKKIATIHDLAIHLPEFSEYNFAGEYFKKNDLNC